MTLADSQSQNHRCIVVSGMRTQANEILILSITIKPAL